MIEHFNNHRDRKSLIRLWRACGLTRDWNNPDLDIDRKMTDAHGLFPVIRSEGEVIASAMIGYDGHRGSIYYLAVHPDHQKLGLGAKLMDYAEAELKKLGCPKLNLLVRTGNLAVLDFYARLDYQQDEVVSLGKRLIED